MKIEYAIVEHGMDQRFLLKTQETRNLSTATIASLCGEEFHQGQGGCWSEWPLTFVLFDADILLAKENYFPIEQSLANLLDLTVRAICPHPHSADLGTDAGRKWSHGNALVLSLANGCD